MYPRYVEGGSFEQRQLSCAAALSAAGAAAVDAAVW
jgi:hypothetical protein